ncbi:MAG: alanyl-tRNA editing protein [Anaerolineae bacterium]|nr:alanyl-tRNA editing protein [Anaerolineae bacterium]
MSLPYPDRLFYTDAYLDHFDARVVERLAWEGRPAVVLDRTAFYPTAGGQPADAGTLSGVCVADVVVREADGAVVHVLEDDLPSDEVAGEIDWMRRFDHMQHHTGQHLLSAACEQLLDADTVSFHLGSEVCTIDLAVERLSPPAVEQAEALVNQIIWEDRPVTTLFATPGELAHVPLRRPPQVAGPVRLVDVAGFDVNPCGGTHVAHTGEIGLLKVVRLEYRAQETRVAFLCGGRALRDYAAKHQTLMDLAAALTVGYWELPEAIERLQEELKATRKDLRAVRTQVLEEMAARLAREATSEGPLRVVREVLEGVSAGDLRGLARGVAAQPSTLVLLASREERTHLCFAAADGVSVDAAALLRAACEALGGKGGGQPGMAQGSAPLTDRDRIVGVLANLYDV